MKTTLKIAFLAVSMVLSACGPIPEKIYTFDTGSYLLSSVKVTTSDQCELLSVYNETGKSIGVTVTGEDVVFNLSNKATANPVTFPKAKLSDNDITNPTAAVYTESETSECVVEVTRSVTGFLTADNKADLTLNFSVARKAGTCNGENTSYAVVPCSTTLNFIATKSNK